MKIKFFFAAAALVAALSTPLVSYAGTWEADGAQWRYRDDSGRYVKGDWIQVGDTWYYINEDGTMRTGWLNEGDKWYYLNTADGAMLKNVTQNIGGTDYTFDGSGAWLAGPAVPQNQIQRGWDGLTFTNRNLDYQITFPEGFANVDEYLGGLIDGAGASPEFTVVAPDLTVTVSCVTYTIPANEQITAEQMAQELRPSFIGMDIYQEVGEVTAVSYGGYQYSSISMLYQGILKQDIYLRCHGNQIILLQLLYEPGHKGMVDGILATIQKP